MLDARKAARLALWHDHSLAMTFGRRRAVVTGVRQLVQPVRDGGMVIGFVVVSR